MAKKVYGLKRITIGDPGANGVMGTVLSEIFGETVLGSATLTLEKSSKEGVKTEESDNAIFFIEGEAPVFTLNASTYNIAARVMFSLFGGSYAAAGGVLTKGAITAGTLYTNGVYTDVPLTGGTGNGASADITVAGGAVTAVAIKSKGSGYTVADVLSALAINIGGTGAGFATPVATLYTGLESWDAAVGGIKPTFEQSVIAETRTGVKFRFVKMDLSAGLAVAFDKTKLGQIDWTGLLLEPDAAVPAWGIDWPA